MRDAANAYARRAFTPCNTPCACTETDAHTLRIPTRTALMGRAWAISGTAVLLGAAGHTLAGASALVVKFNFTVRPGPGMEERVIGSR